MSFWRARDKKPWGVHRVRWVTWRAGVPGLSGSFDLAMCWHGVCKNARKILTWGALVSIRGCFVCGVDPVCLCVWKSLGAFDGAWEISRYVGRARSGRRYMPDGLWGGCLYWGMCKKMSVSYWAGCQRTDRRL